VSIAAAAKFASSRSMTRVGLGLLRAAQTTCRLTCARRPREGEGACVASPRPLADLRETIGARVRALLPDLGDRLRVTAGRFPRAFAVHIPSNSLVHAALGFLTMHKGTHEERRNVIKCVEDTPR
jgi:hypothetical protein